MEWKQPIPTNLIESCNGNKFATTVFEKLLLRARNDDGYIYINSEPVFLKRGQCFCGRFELAEWFGLKRTQSNKIWRVLDFLQKTVKQIDKQKTRNGSIITVLNYNSLTNFEQSNEQSKDNQKTIKRQSKDTNKNDKNDKNDKNIIPEQKEAEELILKYLNIEDITNKTNRSYIKRLYNYFKKDLGQVEQLLKAVKFFEKTAYPYAIYSVRSLYEKKEKIIARIKQEQQRRSSSEVSIAKIK